MSTAASTLSSAATADTSSDHLPSSILQKALLIGSPYGELKGVKKDIETMAKLLTSRGFEIELCCDEQATRDGIFEAWNSIIEKSVEGDAVVVYYSGHGGIAEATEVGPESQAGRPWRFQFIVPTDFDSTTDDDFRGIVDVELSHLLSALTAKTRNVTIILDCCHSGRMARDPKLTPRGLRNICHQGVANHVQRLRDKGQLQGNNNYMAGNPHAVRLVAAAATETAYEYVNSKNDDIGVFTEALELFITAVGNRPVSWTSILRRVQDRVAIISHQHPHIEGPASRTLFSLSESDHYGVLKVFLVQDKAFLDGGRIAGVEEGDVYALMPSDVDAINPERQIGTATVIAVGNVAARVRIEYRKQHDHLSVKGAQAFPQEKGILRWAVRIDSESTTFASFLHERLSRSQMVRVFRTDEQEEQNTQDKQDKQDPPLMTVRQTGNEITLLDSQGVPLFRWQLEQDALLAGRQVETIVARLETIARAQHLLRLKGGTGESALEPPLDIEWGRVENGNKIQLPDKGATLITGQSVYVSLHNTGSSTVFVSIFDIGITGNIALLSYKARGVPIPAGGREYLGDRDFDGTLLGLELSWPDGVLKELTGYEAFAIVSTSEEHDLTTLQTPVTLQPQRPPRRGNDTSELLWIVDQISYGGTRETSPQRLHDFRYDVKHINFVLEPPIE